MAELTVKQEGFSRDCLVMNQSDAYRNNYDCSNTLPENIHTNASQLASNPKVAQRIEELRQADQAKLAEKRVWDKVRLIDEAEINVSLGRELKQIPASNTALTLIGKLTGELVDQPASSGIDAASISGFAAGYTIAQLAPRFPNKNRRRLVAEVALGAEKNFKNKNKDGE